MRMRSTGPNGIIATARSRKEKNWPIPAIDIAANRYTPVIAAGPGIVAWADFG